MTASKEVSSTCDPVSFTGGLCGVMVLYVESSHLALCFLCSASQSSRLLMAVIDSLSNHGYVLDIFQFYVIIKSTNYADICRVIISFLHRHVSYLYVSMGSYDNTRPSMHGILHDNITQ